MRIQASEHSVPPYFLDGTDRPARLNIANLLMKKWSGRVDSNHRPLGPEPMHNSQTGSRNRQLCAKHKTNISPSEPSSPTMAHHNHFDVVYLTAPRRAECQRPQSYGYVAPAPPPHRASP